MKILYDCFSCSPYYGSDEGIGWIWPYLMRRYHEVWALVRTDRRTDIEKYCQENGIEDIHFVYCDIPDWMNFYYKRKKKNKNGTLDFLAYQYLWQFSAVNTAKRLHKKVHFDLVHHVSTNDFRLLGQMYKLKIPYIIGPIGGAQETPEALTYYIREHRKSEKLRAMLNRLMVSLPGYKKSIKQAGRIYFSNQETMEYLRPYICEPRKCEILTEIGCLSNSINETADTSMPKVKEETVFMWAGRMEYRKGLELLVDALKCLPLEKKWKVVLCGDGTDKVHIQSLCEAESFANRVFFPGKISYKEVQRMYKTANAFVFPSLRETMGTVIVEAMSHGLPAICLAQGGGKLVVTQETGFLISVENREKCVREFAQAMEYCMDNPICVERMGKRAMERIKSDYMWETKCENMERVYRELVPEEKAPG